MTLYNLVTDGSNGASPWDVIQISSEDIDNIWEWELGGDKSNFESVVGVP